MIIKKMFFLLIITLLLQGCASGRVGQELQQGKLDFTAGNYHEAFHQLLPLAIDGHAQAQYAVGYMYYYGYGVARDCETGMFWITKSANTGFIPARVALKVLREQCSLCGPPPCGIPELPPCKASYSYKETVLAPKVASQDVILQSVQPPSSVIKREYSSDQVLKMMV